MIASPERAALEVLAPSVYSYVTSDGNTQRANIEAFSHYGNARTRNERSPAYLLYTLSDDNASGGFD
jgi:hypothetical protein